MKHEFVHRISPPIADLQVWPTWIGLLRWKKHVVEKNIGAESKGEISEDCSSTSHSQYGSCSVPDYFFLRRGGADLLMMEWWNRLGRNVGKFPLYTPQHSFHIWIAIHVVYKHYILGKDFSGPFQGPCTFLLKRILRFFWGNFGGQCRFGKMKFILKLSFQTGVCKADLATTKPSVRCRDQLLSR